MRDPAPPAALPGDGSRRTARFAAAAVLALLIAVQVSEGVRVASLPGVQLVSWNVIIDDGFYYLQVARNLARGHGSTFDRINRTNGYQPLWAAMLVPIFFFTDDAVTGMRAALVLATLAGSLSLLLLFLGLQRLVGLGSALLASALVLANPYFLEILHGGLETPAVLLCLSGLLAFWAYRGEAVLRGERRACLGVGALLGLTALARTDLLLALSPFGLALVLLDASPAATASGSQEPAPTGKDGWLRQRLRRGLWIGLPAAGLLAPFALFSLITQGSPVPVSGLVKRWVALTFTPTRELWNVTEQWRGLARTVHLLAWPYRIALPEAISQINSGLLLAGAVLLLLALRLVWSRRARENRLAFAILATAALGLAGHGAYLFFIYRSTGHWNYHYFFPAALVFTVMVALTVPLLFADLGLLVDRLLHGRLRSGFAALGVALVLPAMAGLLYRGLPAFEERLRDLRRPAAQSFRKSRWDAAEHIRRRYAHDEVFGAWWAGTLGYLSDRRVVNLDGVINSGRFYREVLRTSSVPDYLLRGPVRHLCDFFWHNPMTGPPSLRAFFWEHEKEHVVTRLRPHLRLTAMFPYQGEAAMYLLDLRP